MTDEEYQTYKQPLIQLIQAGYELMVFHYGLGETAIFAQLIAEYRHEHPDNKLAVITVSPSRTDILKACPYIDEVLMVTPDFYKKLSEDYQFLLVCRIKHFGLLYTTPLLHTDTMIHRFTSFMYISDDSPLERYQLPYNAASVDALFTDNSLNPERTAFLIPHALCFGDNVIPAEVWASICNMLKEKGYTPVFNSNKEVVAGVPYIYPNMGDSLEFTRRCGAIAGVRTGFVDLVAAFTDAAIYTVYPSDDNPIWTDNPAISKYNDGPDKSLRYIEEVNILDAFRRDNIFEAIYENEETSLAEFSEFYE